LRIVVQSERGPKYLEERVEAFLESMKGTIEEMPHELFEEQKAGLERKWTEAQKNLAEETNSYWIHIDGGYLDFMRSE
jgi:insulysin